MLFVLIVCVFLVVSYAVYAMVKAGGVPASLSASYYLLGERGWVFQAVMFSVGILLLPVWMRATEEVYQWLCFLSCASLLFVAAAPNFRLELEGKVHYGSAIVCCVCAVLWQILEGLWDVTLWFALIGGMLSIQYRDKYMWFVEFSVIGSLFCNLFRV